jgi:phospho-N-acetylmuramoyl-pentapeptide-transferase
MNGAVRLALAAAIAFLVTFIASRLMIPWLKKRKARQHIREDGPQSHLVKEGTPTMGGIMIVLGLAAAVLCFSVYAGNGAGLTVLFLLLTTLLFAAIGFWDDAVKLLWKRSLGLRAWQKIVLQVAAAGIAACLSYFALGNTYEAVPFAKTAWNLGAAQIPFTMFVFIAMVNSVNLTDGLDGLAASLTLMNASAWLVIILLAAPGLLANGAGRETNTAVFAAALIGACIAFLCFNAHPAKVFMGDTGSFALGSALTAVATTARLQLLLPVMGLMFVLSAISVIIQVGTFKLRGKRVFRMAPLHHHFELGGKTEMQVVRGYLLITIVLSVMSVLSVGI